MKKKVFLILSILLLAGFTVVYFVKPYVKTNMKIGQPPTGAGNTSLKSTADLRQEIENLATAYQGDCQKLLLAFQKDVKEKISPDFDRARNSVPDVIGRVGNFKACVKLCYKAAKDKVSGTHDFEDALTTALDSPIIQPCLHADRIAADELAALELHLRERQVRYSVDLASISNSPASARFLSSADIEHLQKCLNSFEKNVQQYQQGKIMAAIGAAFEIVFIRETCKIVAELLAKPISKICGSLSASAICAVSDGPLPICDVIAGVITVGGMAWTVKDVYDAMYAMPKQLKSDLHAGIDRTEKELLKQMQEQAQKLCDEYQKTGQDLKTKSCECL